MLAKIARSWKPSTVHGINLFWKELSFRSLLGILWVSMCMALGLWEISNIMATFLRFDVKTKVEVVPASSDGLPFPAVTFCSSNIGLKSFLGGSPEQRQGMMLLMTRTTNILTLKQMSSTCEDPSVPKHDFTNNEDLVTVLKKAMVDSVNAVKHCEWNQQNLNCSRLFVNKPTDSGVCFTLNPDRELLRTYGLVKASDAKMEWTKKTYGTSIQESKQFISHNTGLKSGLSLILLTNTSEYCGSVQEQAGFIVVVHDNAAEPLLQMTADIRLSAGFATNVAMTLRKTERKTESYGFCKSSLNLRMYQGYVSYTSSDYVAQNCLSEHIMLKCACVPFYNPRTNTFLYGKVKELFWLQKPNTSVVETCGFDSSSTINDINCQLGLENNLTRADSICYHLAPKPCKETNIQTRVSFAKYPTKQMLPSLNRQLGTNFTLQQFQSNFIFVNFYYDDDKFTRITEKIKMTWVDLMNQMGGAAGMTLGISIIGLVECFFWLLTRPISLINNFDKRLCKRSHFSHVKYIPHK